MKHSFAVLGFLALTTLAVPGVAHAQTFKVDKFDIKGDGGTDHVAVEAATGARLRFAGNPHDVVVDGGTGNVGWRYSQHAGRAWRGHCYQGRSRLYD